MSNSRKSPNLLARNVPLSRSRSRSRRGNGRQAASIVAVVDARPATIAATGSHSPAPTMDDQPTGNGGGTFARCPSCGRLLIQGQACVCGGGR